MAKTWDLGQFVNVPMAFLLFFCENWYMVYQIGFFKSNTKCLEQIDFAAPVFIMQEEFSLIR